MRLSEEELEEDMLFIKCAKCEAQKLIIENLRDQLDMNKRIYDSRVAELQDLLKKSEERVDKLLKEMFPYVPTDESPSDKLEPVGGFRGWRDIRRELESRDRRRYMEEKNASGEQ